VRFYREGVTNGEDAVKILSYAIVCALLVSPACAGDLNPAFFAKLKEYAGMLIAQNIEPSGCLLVAELKMAPLIPNDATIVPPEALERANKDLGQTKLRHGGHCPLITIQSASTTGQGH